MQQLNSNWAVIARRIAIAGWILAQAALGQAQPPNAISLTPSSGSGSAASFTAAFSDASGASQIGDSSVYISSQLGGGIFCTVGYSFGVFWLVNDAGTALYGPVSAGSSNSAANSSCSISGIGASAVTSGTSLIWTMPITFTASFAGAKNIWLAANNYNTGLSSGFVQRGTWTVGSTPVSVSVSPATVSLSPSQQQQFSATVTGTTSTAVVWSMNPSLGSLSSSGLYTAPSTITSGQTVTVTATSVANSSKSGSQREPAGLHATRLCIRVDQPYYGGPQRGVPGFLQLR